MKSIIRIAVAAGFLFLAVTSTTHAQIGFQLGDGPAARIGDRIGFRMGDRFSDGSGTGCNSGCNSNCNGGCDGGCNGNPGNGGCGLSGRGNGGLFGSGECGLTSPVRGWNFNGDSGILPLRRGGAANCNCGQSGCDGSICGGGILGAGMVGGGIVGSGVGRGMVRNSINGVGNVLNGVGNGPVSRLAGGIGEGMLIGAASGAVTGVASGVRSRIPPIRSYLPTIRGRFRGRGFYLLAGVGVNIFEEGSDFSAEGVEPDDPAVYRVAVGRRRGLWRTEIEASYREIGFELAGSPLLDFANTVSRADGFRNSTTLSYNLIRDFAAFGKGRFTPYGKAGVGLTLNNTSADVAGTTFVAGPFGPVEVPFNENFPRQDELTVDFAWQAGGGISFAMTRRITMDLEYLFFELGDAETAPGLFTNQSLDFGPGIGHQATVNFRMDF